MPGIADTLERRAVVKRLTDALYEYLTLDCTEYERAASLATPRMAFVPRSMPDPAEQLAKAVENRDRTQERLQAMRRQLEDVPEVMRTAVEMTMIGPLEDTLRGQEDWISELQKQIESKAAL